ncbi:hypothetical protein JCM16303_004517 [Sporobolomyces ruberrimus]
MEYQDQYITLPSQQPSFQLQPPTPITSSLAPSTFVIPATSTVPSPVAIPPSARPNSRGGTPASSLSRSSSRHHPYGVSPASFTSSFSDRSFRPRSATSTSERSDWESEASAYDTDYDPRLGNSPDFVGFPQLDLPFIADAALPQPPPTSYTSPHPAPEPTQSPRVSKNGKPKKSHARKTAPGHIKRPPNAFILFRSHCCAPKGDSSEPDPPGTAHARHLASLDINNSQHVSLIVSQLWKGLKPDEKAYWDKKALDAKEEHQRLHPEYRYKPQQRAKETMRKRKRPDPIESKEHRDACHEVARIVLEQEGATSEAAHGVATGRDDFGVEVGSELQLPVPPPSASRRGGTSLMEEILDGGAGRRSASNTRSPKRPTRKTKSKAPASDASSPPSLGLPTPPALFDPFSRPSTGSYPSVLDDSDHSRFVDPFAQRSIQDHDGSPFAFMAQLEQQSAKSTGPVNPLFAVDPKYGFVSSSIDGQALHPLSQPSSSRPSSGGFPYQPALASRSSPPATAIGFSRSPSPTSEAIRRMQSYSLGGPSPPTRPHTSLPPRSVPPSTSAAYAFGTCSPAQDQNELPPLARRRDIQFPPNLPLSALKHRRSTIRPGQQVDPTGRGDLMLISPLTTTFNGRRQSLGFSSGLRRVSLGWPGVGAGEETSGLPYRKSSLSSGVLAGDPSFETLAFPQDVLESFPLENPFTDPDFLAQFEHSAPLMPDVEYEHDRPGTASSAWSAADGDSNTVERLEASFPAGFFDRRRSTLVASKLPPSESRSPHYHVDSTAFFGLPDPPLSTSGSQTNQPAVPAFGSAEFGGSFQPFAQRQSIGNLFASSLAAFNHNVTPTFSSDDPSNPFAKEQPEWTAASMKDTALSILHEHRNQASPVENGSAECEYVLLPIEQLGDTELMTKLHQQGYGIAFETAPLTSFPPSSVNPQAQTAAGLPSGATMSIDESHPFSRSSQ